MPIQIRLATAGPPAYLRSYVAVEQAADGTQTVVGRALLNTALAALRLAGYRRVVLWTLTGNARARRFYDKAGFAPDGATNVLAGLGGVEELRYARDLRSRLFPAGPGETAVTAAWDHGTS
jgi:predicted N-acetyltransferase YhbS